MVGRVVGVTDGDTVAVLDPGMEWRTKAAYCLLLAVSGRYL